MNITITIERANSAGYIIASALGMKGSGHTTTIEAVSSLMNALKNRHDRLSDVPTEFISEEGRVSLAALEDVFRPKARKA